MRSSPFTPPKEKTRSCLYAETGSQNCLSQDSFRLPLLASKARRNQHYTMPYQSIDDRSERELEWINNPSAPLTEEELKGFIEDASSILLQTLDKQEERSIAR